MWSAFRSDMEGEAMTPERELLPAFIRKRIESAIEDALHPKGMSTHSGMALVHVADIQRLLKVIDALLALPAIAAMHSKSVNNAAGTGAKGNANAEASVPSTPARPVPAA